MTNSSIKKSVDYVELIPNHILIANPLYRPLFIHIHSTDFFLKYLFALSTYCTTENTTNVFQFIIMQLFCNGLDFNLLVTGLYLF